MSCRGEILLNHRVTKFRYGVNYMTKIHRSRPAAIILLLFILAVLAAGCGTAKTTQPGSAVTKKLKVGYNATGGSVLTFIAQDQNLFQQEGLEVELVPFSSTSDGLNALNSGKIDIGVSFGTGGPLTLINNGADLVIIGGHLSGGHPLLSTKEKAGQFKTIQDWKGKTVADPRLYTSDVVWRGALKKAGIDINKDLNVIEMKNPQGVVEALQSGKVDAGIGSSSVYLQAKEAGLAIIGWSNDLFPDHPCCRVVARGEAVQADPEAYKSFLKALIRAEKVKTENPDIAVKANEKFLKINEQLAREFTLEPHQVVSSDPNRKAVLHMWEDMKATGYIDAKVDIAKYINTDLYGKAVAELKKQFPDDGFYQQVEKRFAEQN